MPVFWFSLMASMFSPTPSSVSGARPFPLRGPRCLCVFRTLYYAITQWRLFAVCVCVCVCVVGVGGLFFCFLQSLDNQRLINAPFPVKHLPPIGKPDSRSCFHSLESNWSQDCFYALVACCLDAVIISHNHYDHLDLETVKSLKDNVREDVIVCLIFATHHRGTPSYARHCLSHCCL